MNFRVFYKVEVEESWIGLVKVDCEVSVVSDRDVFYPLLNVTSENEVVVCEQCVDCEFHVI